MKLLKPLPTVLTIIYIIFQALLAYIFMTSTPKHAPDPQDLALSFPDSTPTSENGDAALESEPAADEGESDSEDPTEENGGAEDGTATGSGGGNGNDGNGQQPPPPPDPEPEPEPDPPPEPEPKIILCLGDSVTYGTPLEGTGQTYPARLQTKLDAKYGPGKITVVNKGVGGYRADQVRDAASGWLQTHNPDIVLLMVGGNDLIQETVPQTPEKLFQVINQTTSEVQQIIDIVKAHTNPDGSHPRIIVSAFIPNLYNGVLGTTGVWAYNLNLQDNLTGYERYFTSNWDDFYDPNTDQARTELMTAGDPFHPNAAGYEVMADNWYIEVIDFL